MKIRIKGEMTIAELKQAIFEQIRDLEDRFAIRYSRDVTIYLTLTNGFGDEVICKDPMGNVIRTLYCGGAYHSAAAEYRI